MASPIYSVPAGSYGKCEAFSEDLKKFNADESYGPVKVGASGGTTTDFWGDIDGFWYQGGYPEDKARFYGDNGLDHFAIFLFGGGNYSRWMNGQFVSGIQFKENNDSTAGRGIYVLRYGIAITNGSSRENYDLSGEMSRPNSYGKTHTANFNSALMSRLNGGWFIEKFIVEISSAGGSGGRKSNTSVSDLKFKTAGPSGSNLVLPVVRSKADRAKTDWIGKLQLRNILQKKTKI
jgi:hypothetical protein